MPPQEPPDLTIAVFTTVVLDLLVDLTRLVQRGNMRPAQRLFTELRLLMYKPVVDAATVPGFAAWYARFLDFLKGRHDLVGVSWQELQDLADTLRPFK